MSLTEYLRDVSQKNIGPENLLRYLKLSRKRFFAMKKSISFQVKYPLPPSTCITDVLRLMDKYSARGFGWLIFLQKDSITINVMWNNATAGKAAELQTTTKEAIRSETLVTEDELIEIALCGISEITFYCVCDSVDNMINDIAERERLMKMWQSKGFSSSRDNNHLWISWK